MVLPAAPIPAREMLEGARKQDGRLDRKNYQIEGVKTLPASVDSASTYTNELLRECRRRFKRRSDPAAIMNLLNDHPWLIVDPWVREKFFTFAHAGRLRRHPGRPRGTFTVHPLLIYGLVQECIAAKLEKNRHRAFDWVSSRLGCVRPDRVKQLYDQAMQDSRFRATLLEFSDQVRPATADEIAHLEMAKQLRPGAPITWTVEHPEWRKVEAVFEALP
jgi:hypothetical protein